MALVVGRLVAQLALEDAGVQSGLAQAEAGMRRTATAADQATASTSRLGTAQSGTATAAGSMAGAQTTAATASTRATTAVTAQAGATTRLVGSQGAAATATGRMAGAQTAAATATGRATTATTALSGATTAAAGASSAHTAAATRQTGALTTLSAAATNARNMLGTLGITLGAAGAVTFFTNAITSAREMEAITLRVQNTFEDAQGTVQDWAAETGSSLRMSEQAAQSAALQFSTFGLALGQSGEELAGFSTGLAEVAGDLAAYGDYDISTVVQDMTAALSGSTETMAKYGVLLNDTRLREIAFAEGITESNRQLTVNEKVMVTAIALHQGLEYAVGANERAQGSFGDSVRNLQARFADWRAEIGGKLMPIAQAFIDLLAGPGMAALSGVGEILGVLGTVVGTLTSAFSSLPGPIQAAIAAIVAMRIAGATMGGVFATMRTRITDAFTGFTGQVGNVRRAAAITGQSMGVVRGSVVAFGHAVRDSSPLLTNMQASFYRARSEARHFPNVMGAASAAATGFRGAMGGLMGVLGGPWGLAITGATIGIGLLIQKKQEAAQKAQEAENRVKGFAQALSASNGIVNDSVRELVAQDDRFQSLMNTYREHEDAMKRAGIAQTDFIETITDSENATGELTANLFKLRNEGDLSVWTFQTMLGQMGDLTDEFNRGREASDNMKDGVAGAGAAFQDSANATSEMSEAMAEYAEETGGAASQVKVLTDALNKLNGDELTQSDALQAWSDGLRDFKEDLDAAAIASVDASGKIDVTTEAGSALYDSVKDQAEAFNETAAAAKRYADSQGWDVATSLEYVNGVLQEHYDEFINVMVAQGMTREAAEALAEEYNIFPDSVTTRFEAIGIDEAIQGLNDLEAKGKKLEPGEFFVTDNTPQVRAKLDQLGVDYEIIDGKVVLTDNSPETIAALDEVGATVEGLPDRYIDITDNSPEVIQKLKDLGIEVHELPDGTIVIAADDADFHAAVARATETETKYIRLEALGGGNIGATFADGGIRSRRDGALDEPTIRRGAGQGQLAMSPLGPVRWAEGETDWEAYIPGAVSKRGRALPILAEVARRFGMMLLPQAAQVMAMAEGGIISAGQLKDYMRGLDGGSYVWGGWGNGFNTDCSGGQSIAVMASALGNMNPGTGERSGTAGYSAYLPAHGYQMGRAPAGVAAHEVGWSAEHTAGTIFDPAGGDVNIEMGGAYGNGKYGGTVGSRDGQFPNTAWIALQGDDGSGYYGSGINNPTLTADSSREDVARKIIAEGRERGYTDAEIRSILAMAVQESNLDPNAVGGGGAWKGVFQQDESYVGRDDPNTQVTGFYDRLDEKKGLDGWSDDEFDHNLFWVQQAPGADSADAAVQGGRAEYLDEIRSRDDEAAALLAELGPEVGYRTTTTSTSGRGDAVYVTGGYLDGIGGRTSAPREGGAGTTTTTTEPVTLDEGPDYDGVIEIEPPWMRKFATGGTVPGTGWRDSELILAMPGEEIIRKRVAEQPGMRSFLKAINAGKISPGGPARFADGGTVGGWGGYVEDDRDWMKPQTVMDWVGLATGAGFAAYNMLEPYAQMALSGRVDLSRVMPTLNTGTSDTSMLSSWASDLAGQITQQLDELIYTVAQGHDVRVEVKTQSDSGPAATIAGSMGV